MSDYHIPDPFPTDPLSGGMGTSTLDFDFSTPPPPRRTQRIWLYILAVAGGVLVLGAVIGLIIWISDSDWLAVQRDPPENTLQAYYGALEQLDFQAAAAYIDPTADAGPSLLTTDAVETARQWLFQLLREEWGLSPQLQFANMSFTPVEICDRVAIIDVEFDIYVGLGTDSVLPIPVHVQERRVLRRYQGQWYIEP